MGGNYDSGGLKASGWSDPTVDYSFSSEGQQHRPHVQDTTLRPLTTDEQTELVAALPAPVKAALIANRGRLVVAGGFLRDTITRLSPSDVDLFVMGPEGERKQCALDQAMQLCRIAGAAYGYQSERAVSVTMPDGPPIQLTWAHGFETPEQVIAGFDFTICQVAIWWVGDGWAGICSNRFRTDCDKMLLTPVAGLERSSVRRVIKLFLKGYMPVELRSHSESGLGEFDPAVLHKRIKELEEANKALDTRLKSDEHFLAMVRAKTEVAYGSAG